MPETGFKGTDANGRCRGHQFSLPVQNPDGSWTPGEWHEHDGEVMVCEAGFHFCRDMMKVAGFYGGGSDRLFAVEAEGVVHGDDKSVCRRIRLTSEVFDRNQGNGNQGRWNLGDGNQGNDNQGNDNQGDGNRGHSNQGSRNRGSGNKGNNNQGDWNQGDGNCGDGNCGDVNRGNSNQGSRNHGNDNQGDWNNGDENRGDENRGNRNHGNWNNGNDNQGDWNIGIGCAAASGTCGFLGYGEFSVLWNGFVVKMSPKALLEKYPEILDLSRKAATGCDINPSDYADIPGYTPERLQALIDAHEELRNA